MIISELIGGLGNQMFQYAAGWALARDKNTFLKLDVSGFANYALHQGYELNRVFESQGSVASEQDLQQLLGWQSSLLVRRVLRQPCMKSLRKSSLLIEFGFPYSDLRPQVSDHGYLSGYWQSEKYFLNCADEIRSHFRFKPLLSPENEKWVELISKKNSVSVHVRRGDFIKSKNIAYHGVCSVEYFDSAARLMMERNPDVEFFIFSDDVAWVKSNINLSAPCHFVVNNIGVESFNDMRLMSLCKHNITANSSFSWWGAWLNANPLKTIIAPAKWFAADIDVRDLIPSSWVTL